MASIRPMLRGLLLLTTVLATTGPLLADSLDNGGQPAVEPLAIDRPLIAQWNFDEPSADRCLDASGNGNDGVPQNTPAAGMQRIPGVFAGAVRLSGSHTLRVPGGPDFAPVHTISLSAWVMPSELGDYREIFRKEDGDNRVLFSFQDERHDPLAGLERRRLRRVRRPDRSRRSSSTARGTTARPRSTAA